MDLNAAEIIRREQLLFTSEVRASEEKLKQLLADNFVEIGASGVMFDKSEALARIPFEPPIKVLADSFVPCFIEEDCARLLYRSILYKPQNEQGLYSRRCSFWQRINGDWQMIYHQGTPCQPFTIEEK